MEAFNTTEDEPRYLQWLAAHPAGFVVNAARPTATPRYLKLHSASCWTIGANASGGGRLTGRQYQKVCSTSRNELEDWASKAVGGELSPCGACLASGARPSPVRTARAERIQPAATHTPTGAIPAAPLAGSLPKRWQPGNVLASVEGIRPLLASWESAHKPAQVRLKAYLDDLESRLTMDTLPRKGLYLDLVVDVEVAERLSRHYDLENYLTPIAARLGASRFVYVRAIKRVGGGSTIEIGVAVEDSVPLGAPWMSLGLDAGSGASQKSWKEGIRAALATSGVEKLPPGPVAVDLSWRCGPTRNWVTLWKPTGDAMGPVLGEPDPHHPFNVADDRIVELRLHRDVDSDNGHDVHVGLAWRTGG